MTRTPNDISLHLQLALSILIKFVTAFSRVMMELRPPDDGNEPNYGKIVTFSFPFDEFFMMFTRQVSGHKIFASANLYDLANE